MKQCIKFINQKVLINLILLIIFCNLLSQIMTFDYDLLLNNPEFFINYSTGFIRRGLDGEIIFLLIKITDFDPLIIRFIYWLCNVIIFLAISFRFFYKKFPLYFIFTSTLVLAEFYGSYIFKKDIILINLFFLIIYCSKFKISIQILIFNSLLIIGTLIHEVFFLFALMPTVLLLKNDKSKIFSFLFLLPSIFVFIVLTMFYMGDVNRLFAIINSWQNSRINTETMSYLFTVFGDNSRFYIYNVMKSVFDYFGLLFSIVFNFIFIVIIVYRNDSRNITKFVFLFLIQNVVLILLCTVAIDFGRWFFFANLTSLYTYQKITCTWFLEGNENFVNFIPKNEFYTFVLFLFLGCTPGIWNLKDYVVSTPAFKIYVTPKIIYNLVK